MPRRRGTYRIVPNAVRRSAALLSDEEEDSSAASAWQARYDKMVREQEAEEARRRSLHPTERLAEDGAKLRTEIESHDDMSVVLEVSASARAVCRAGRDCFYIRPPPSGGDDYYYQAYRDGGGGGGGAAIQDDFRIRVNGVRGELAHWRMHHFYHVLCFVAMMDVEELIPSRKFTFECGPGWGLMVRKWEKHRGRVDLDVLAKFIDDMEQWEEEKKEENSTSETSAATTSSTQEKKPVLRNYVTTTSTDAEAGTNLWELMKHPHIWKGTSFILPTANGPKAYGPWAESWEEEEDLPSEEDALTQRRES
ncbi:uncharacterized protein B0T15DRAFT_511182 [Chaetomium strumarium]|uniref:Uncharacterized protein n=1 Tax=Chaetomium strumarium TaxID=1170767 RepID=A0AAJ0GSD9_9PEZI|nr:hypothetical protein B0T15DRAFT_511182 [Chaetomium strumarium]